MLAKKFTRKIERLVRIQAWIDLLRLGRSLVLNLDVGFSHFLIHWINRDLKVFNFLIPNITNLQYTFLNNLKILLLSSFITTTLAILLLKVFEITTNVMYLISRFLHLCPKLLPDQEKERQIRPNPHQIRLSQLDQSKIEIKWRPVKRSSVRWLNEVIDKFVFSAAKLMFQVSV